MGVGRRLVDGLAEATNRLGIRSLVLWAGNRRVTILCYHSVVDRPVPPEVARTGLHLDVARFTTQMEFLANHCEVLPLTEALARTGGASARPVVAVTFDDGYANNLSVASPVMERFGIPATVFLVTELLSANEPFWWDELKLLGPHKSSARIELPRLGKVQIDRSAAGRADWSRIRRCLQGLVPADRRLILDPLRRLAADPPDASLVDLIRPLRTEELGLFPGSVRFGNHTATHRVLTDLDDAAVEWEIETAAEALSRLASDRQIPNVVCYPRGSVSPLVEAVVRRLGYTGLGLREDRGRGSFGLGAPPVNLPRIIVGAHQSHARFEWATAGIVT